MKIETRTLIEVSNIEHEWAVNLERCNPEMHPVKMNFVLVINEISDYVIFIDNMLTDRKPEKTINFISDDYIEVGFWKIKVKLNHYK